MVNLTAIKLYCLTTYPTFHIKLRLNRVNYVYVITDVQYQFEVF